MTNVEFVTSQFTNLYEVATLPLLGLRVRVWLFWHWRQNCNWATFPLVPKWHAAILPLEVK